MKKKKKKYLKVYRECCESESVRVCVCVTIKITDLRFVSCEADRVL